MLFIKKVLSKFEINIFETKFCRYTNSNQSTFIDKKDVTLGSNMYLEEDVKIKIRNGGRITIGDNCEILYGVLIITYGGDISIGNNCSINPYTIIYGHGGTKIGNNVLIAGHCTIIPNNHVFQTKTKFIREQGNISKGITIEDDVWIGHGCSILDGVKISKGSIIAAGAVVNRDVPPYGVVGGVPARIIKYRN